MMGDLGLDDGSSSGRSHLCTLSIAGQTGCIVFLRVTSRVRRVALREGRRRGVEGQEVRRGEKLGAGVGGGLSVGREDDGRVRRPQRPRRRPEQRRTQEGCLDEGGGGGGRAHWVAQRQRVGGHRAQGGRGQRAGQEAGRQALGQLLLQGQFGLEEEP